MNDSMIETWSDLLDAAEDAQKELGEKDAEPWKPWYRGHANSDWTLVPSVYRYRGRDARRGEKWLMGQFMMRAPSRCDRCPGNSEYAVWLTLARHYGLWTRLLDWTESILVAAFFAVSDEKEDAYDGAIWALNPHGLNNSECGNRAVNPLFLEPASKVVFPAFGAHANEPAQEKKILAAGAPERDLRMLVQQSAYTVHGCVTPLQELDGAVKESKGKPPFLRKYVVPAGKKKGLRQKLASVGYTTAGLFPDLEHLAGGLNAEADQNHGAPTFDK